MRSFRSNPSSSKSKMSLLRLDLETLFPASSCVHVLVVGVVDFSFVDATAVEAQRTGKELFRGLLERKTGKDRNENRVSIL